MADNITWGREIAANGVRPAWTKDDDRIKWSHADGYGSSTDAANLNWCGTTVQPTPVATIRLPADHFAYTVFDWNDAHPDEQPFEPWAGGESAPEDWDGGEVLHRLGYKTEALDWSTINEYKSVIGYRKRSIPQPESDTVTIKRMTLAEWNSWYRDQTRDAGLTAYMAAELLGLIRAETRAEQIARTTGVSLADVEKVLEAAK